MKIKKNIDKCNVIGVSDLSEGGDSFKCGPEQWQGMKIRLFHVYLFFCPMFQIKRKKMEEYLFAISFFVYLCVKLNSVT